MKTTKLIVAALAIGSVLSSCKKPADQAPPVDSTTVARPGAVDSAKMAMGAEWDKFKAESEQKIKNIEDSLAAYDAKMKSMTPQQKKVREEVKARSAALRARLAQKPDEAAGSWKRAGDAISGGVDSLGDMVTGIVNPSSKNKK